MKELRRALDERIRRAPPRSQDAQTAARFLLAGLRNLETDPHIPVVAQLIASDLARFEAAMAAENGR